MCRDGDYPTIKNALQIYRDLDQRVWNHIIARGIVYRPKFPDCDDFGDIKLGRFKEEWWLLVQNGLIPEETPPKYGICDGYNPAGELHDFNMFIVGEQIFISDYGSIVTPNGYKPLKVRF